jgi:hypothetical protein
MSPNVKTNSVQGIIGTILETAVPVRPLFKAAATLPSVGRVQMSLTANAIRVNQQASSIYIDANDEFRRYRSRRSLVYKAVTARLTRRS